MGWNLWILAVISSTTFALPTSPKTLNLFLTKPDLRNSIIENAILSFLESIRQDMVTGEGSIPVLDPFHQEHLRVEGDGFGLYGSYIDMTEVNINNLSYFSVESLSVSLINILLQRYRILLDVRIPAIDIYSSKYDLLLEVMGYRVFGNGSLGVSVVEPRLRADVVINLRISTSGIIVSIVECEVNFDLIAFESKITGLFNSEIASDFANRFLAFLIPDLVNEYQKEITTTLSKLVMDFLNEIFEELNHIKIIG